MKKDTAIALLGGDIPTAAKCLGLSPHALYQWPEQLSRSMADKVLAARLRLEWHVAIHQDPKARGELSELILDALSV